MVTKFGFASADTTLLVDESATRENILSNLAKYSTLAREGDLIVFYFSGHGTLFPDAYSEVQDESRMISVEAPNAAGEMEQIYERGRYDYAIVPYDARNKTSGKAWRNLIIDDELNAILGSVTRKGAQIVVVLDAGFANSTDLSKQTTITPRTESLAKIFGERHLRDIDFALPSTPPSKAPVSPIRGLYLTIASSAKDEVALETNVSGEPGGLFTSRILAAVTAQKLISYEALMKKVSQEVAAQATNWNVSQMPELSAEFGDPKRAVFSTSTVPGESKAVRSPAPAKVNVPVSGRQEFQGQTNALREITRELLRVGRWNDARIALEISKEAEYNEFFGRPSRQERRNVPNSGVRGSRVQFQKVSFQSNTDCPEDYAQLREDLVTLAARAGEINRKSQRTRADETELLEIRAKLDCAGVAYQKVLRQIFAASDSEEEVAKYHRIPRLRALMSDLRQLSGSGPTALIYTFVTDDEYWLILLTQDVILARSQPVDARVLRDKILYFRRTLQNTHLDPLPLAKELYKELFEPVARDLDNLGIKTIVWSLDKELRYLPIAALHDGQRYLVQKYAHAVTTPAAVSRWKDEPPPTGGVGFGLSDGTPPLPFVLYELNAIFGDGTARSKPILPGRVYPNQRFSIASLRQEVARNAGTGLRTLHIASHFTIVPGPDSKNRSYLSLGENQRFTVADLDNSLNFFSGVHLLVLSACNTAVSESGAEGIGNGVEVESFGVLAQEQGAVSVLATLWPVNDPATSAITPQFYRNWISKVPVTKAVALQRAQIAMIDGKIKSSSTSNTCRAESFAAGGKKDEFKCDPNAPFSHPYFWSPFVLIGNWR